MSSSDADLVMNAFGGAIKVLRVDEPNRAFYYDVTFFLDHPYLAKVTSRGKPPMHFHPFQEEYIQVVEGTLGVEVETTEYRLTAKDGEFSIDPWANHRLYPIMDNALGSGAGDTVGAKTTRFLLSGEKSRQAFQLDDVFFQNWYGYQDEVVMNGGKFDVIQIMNMFDAGGSYLTFPTWIPFSRRFAQVTGIIVGRWIGGLLGYQPFHRKWTSNWPLAVRKMGTTLFFCRFFSQTETD
ncbi:hypothetical protein X797_004766 [Metarhizium robertsii]|uniref:Cupin, RmlC-type n=1 Tax=Metarhizium robertsii TaxID=568076 RepID=A0A0A1UX66_9HYPO|nr:hypothetical protein X797_004766 [Metarhizium robertsii]